ncbi:MAG TPA: rhodanese-like domain-containing protein, partial [Thermoplasmata archaeon]|nr:rhodanese-like domain-containing protein [Thermoplasmata archaeon]
MKPLREARTLMPKTITKEELKARIDRGDDFRLAMALNEWHFEAARIPGSILIQDKQAALSKLRPEEEIVVYCSDDSCFSSKRAVD